MDPLLKKIIDAAGVSGYEKEITAIMQSEFKKRGCSVEVDNFGNVIAKKGSGKKKIMLAAHMDEIGLLVKHITKDGYLNFIKIGGIDDRVLIGQRVIVKSKKGDCFGIIGLKPPHLVKEEEKSKVVKYTEMFIDIGCKTKEEAEKKVAIADSVIFEPNSGVLNNSLCYGKAIDDRVGCYALLKIMEKVNTGAQVFAVATVQEEVGLKGARTSSFKVDPDFALVIDTTSAGDTPMIKESESTLKLGSGAAITIIEAAGRGIIVSEKVREMLVDTARENKIKFQMDVLEGGMTDGAMINMNREGIPCGVLSVPSRYIHSPVSVFSLEDLNSVIELSVKVIKKIA
ncbi:MAG: M42 family metallopeptidase [Candidatus Omnitrophica bacterium]|nr:M42 family metallopeptidase [Candidatus Omnitrophota bacterium]